jgi:hypothetical protein
MPSGRPPARRLGKLAIPGQPLGEVPRCIQVDEDFGFELLMSSTVA